MLDIGSQISFSLTVAPNGLSVSACVGITILAVYALAITVLFFQKFVSGKKHDSLTGMLNLQGFESAAERLFTLVKNQKFLLSELNVRDFAFVNRIYGADKGDLILKRIAAHLSEIKDQSPHTIIARGYADNFYILQPIDGDERDFITAMEITQNNLQEQVGKEEDVHIILKSGNIVCFNHGRETIDLRDMISKVGYARRLTQDSVIENFSIYDANMRIQHENEERIENNIEKAITNKDLLVLYQPKINLETGKIQGAEALVRWKTQNNALIPPDIFIPVLERNGLVGVLDQYVYRKVFSFLKGLNQENIPQVPISMNISRLAHNSLEFITELDTLQLQYQVDKKYIELEIEERFAGAGDDYVKDLIHRLHSAGYAVSMDDFGSGQSSLNMLCEMPVDIVKFDQRFLHQAEGSRDARVVLAYMIKMVNELGKVSLCEGVETKKQVKILQNIGCKVAQGYYYSRPVDEETFKKFILENV
ncbi:MAG: GGDEF domain-containing protein [Treponema sp.]|nr:GGDEF domain-containing protein [Treponema sp.]